MLQEWDLTETNLFRAQTRHYEIAVLPVGAIEAHNYHLPEGQDFLHTSHVAREVCRRAWPKCESVICLPALPYGVDCNLMGFPLTIHVSQRTLDALVGDIVTSLRAHGIKKLLLINGHGGNNFTPLIRQLQCDEDVFIFLCDWWKVAEDQFENIFDSADDHAGEFETSVALALYPQLVELERAVPAAPRKFQFEALEHGWVKTSRNFSKLNDYCAVGDPTKASAEKGRAYLEIVIERISNFVVETAMAPLDEFFPHSPEP